MSFFLEHLHRRFAIAARLNVCHSHLPCISISIPIALQIEFLIPRLMFVCGSERKRRCFMNGDEMNLLTFQIINETAMKHKEQTLTPSRII